MVYRQYEFLSGVSDVVSEKMIESIVLYFALKWFLTTVSPLMTFQSEKRSESLLAYFTFIQFLFRMTSIDFPHILHNREVSQQRESLLHVF